MTSFFCDLVFYLIFKMYRKNIYVKKLKIVLKIYKYEIFTNQIEQIYIYQIGFHQNFD